MGDYGLAEVRSPPAELGQGRPGRVRARDIDFCKER